MMSPHFRLIIGATWIILQKFGIIEIINSVNYYMRIIPVDWGENDKLTSCVYGKHHTHCRIPQVKRRLPHPNPGYRPFAVPFKVR